VAQFSESRRSDGVSVLRAEGEIDMAVLDDLIEQARSCLASSDSVEFDFEGVTFIDSSGLGALVLVSKEAAEQGKGFTLVNVHSAALRLLQVSGLYDTLVRHDGQP